MRHGGDAKLTLISAPAGFGKTTLLVEWLDAATGLGRSTAWLALDGSETASSFWGYVIAALQKAAPGIGATSLSLLEAPQPPPIETVLTTLINELGARAAELVLVLDDYHALDAPDIHEGIAFFLEHLPQGVRVAIATRSDPPLPLARWRANGDLLEIRAAELRFTVEEAAAYLNEVSHLELAAADVATLAERTEGWIAALQLAALSMQGRPDLARFVAGFAGDDRYVVDYLADEVLRRQPDDVQAFLLQTSVLTRLTGALCDAVTGQDGGRARLEALERANLFLVPLDDRRGWYRYHHLFGDVLRARLLDEQPDVVPALHGRASIWWEQHQDTAEAIRHAMAGEDFERAADLVERAIPELRRTRQEATMRRWLLALPDEQVRARPMLSIGLVGALLVSGELEGVETHLRDAERWLERASGGGSGSDASTTPMVVVDEAGFRGLPGAIAIYRAAQAMALGDVDASMTQARRALESIGDGDHLERGSAAGFLGLAHWRRGELGPAARSWAEAAASLELAGHHSDVLGCSIALADIRIAQGRLGDAARIYERGLHLAGDAGAPALRGTADMHVGLSELDLERDDLEGALGHLRASDDLGEHGGLAQNPYRWRVAMAGIRLAEGDPAAAIQLLDDAERRYADDYFPPVRPISAVRARAHLVQGDHGAAIGWVRGAGVLPEDDLNYVREFEHLTLARVLLARAGHDADGDARSDAAGLLGRLLLAAEQGGRTTSVIEILVLQALAQQLDHDIPAALVPLERALLLAEPEDYVRRFVGEGAAMARLLEAAARKGIARTSVERLRGHIGRAAPRATVHQGPVDRLSDRELDVLRLLATDLDGPAIARELVVSLSTVRSHTKNIYAKLGVNSRRAAVSKARDLDLLTPVRTGVPRPDQRRDA